MCGIFALINKSGDGLPYQIVKEATDKLSHRGPDGEGYFLFKNFGLGHKRLSIIDLHERSKQPFEKHDKIIIYNGELYNFRDIRIELIELGYEFSTTSDTEVILSAFDYWGDKALERMEGMWSFILYDKEKEEFWISRDRYGMKPLFKYETVDYIAFASEIKAFSVLPGWEYEYNPEVINEFLVKGKLHYNEETFYKDVTSIAFSNILKFSQFGNLISKEDYYQYPDPKSGGENAQISYLNLFKSAVKNHFISDVPVAVALSGGLDSSSIVCIAENENLSYATFSYVPSEANFSEQEYIEEVLNKYSIENHKVSPTFEAHLEAHQKAIWANEGPALSMNLMSSYLLYQRVNEKGFKVMLAGQGADELLLGYHFYYLLFFKYLFKKKPLLLCVEVFWFIIRYPNLISRYFFKKTKAKNYQQFLNKTKIPRGSDPKPNYKGYLGYYHLYPLLQFEDRMGMANSVEGRFPFLDRNFSDFVLKLPMELKIKRGIRKYILRQAMIDILPKRIINRKDKIGFLSPEQFWIGENKDFFILEIKTRVTENQNWFNKDLLKFIESTLENKEVVHYSFIWRLYSFLKFMEVRF